eukprot:1519645-Amphidinium_carterae.1
MAAILQASLMLENILMAAVLTVQILQPNPKTIVPMHLIPKFTPNKSLAILHGPGFIIELCLLRL